MSLENLPKMISWGQYLHWAEIQYSEYKQSINNDMDDSSFFGKIAHWLAAEYVVLEGWYEIKESDEIIDELISSYDDYCQVLRRCRNAIYHYRKEILDKRIIEAANFKNEFHPWITALRCEFQRFLYFYPYKDFGLNKETEKLREEYEMAIGWLPADIPSVRKFRLYKICFDYCQGNEDSLYEKSPEKDELIRDTLQKLTEIDMNPWVTKLKRLRNRSAY